MNWLQRLFRVRRMEQELDCELRFHFDSQVADKMRDGQSEAEARRTTRLGVWRHGADQGAVPRKPRHALARIHRAGSPLWRSHSHSVAGLFGYCHRGAGARHRRQYARLQPLQPHCTAIDSGATIRRSLVSFERRSPENITPAIPWTSIVFYRDNAKSLSAVMATLDGAPHGVGSR